MAERKDKQKVIGEPMTDDQVRFFLNSQPEDGENGDFHALLIAYRSLRIEDFERFIGFFSAAGRDLSAAGREGLTVRQVMASHSTAAPYLEALDKATA